IDMNLIPQKFSIKSLTLYGCGGYLNINNFTTLTTLKVINTCWDHCIRGLYPDSSWSFFCTENHSCYYMCYYLDFKIENLNSIRNLYIADISFWKLNDVSELSNLRNLKTYHCFHDLIPMIDSLETLVIWVKDNPKTFQINSNLKNLWIYTELPRDDFKHLNFRGT